MQMHEFPGFIHTISHWAVSKKNLGKIPRIHLRFT